MRTDGLFTYLQITLDVAMNQPAWFCPFGDVHRDSDLFTESVWAEWIADKRYRLKHGEIIASVGLGDYNDFMRAHTRAVVDAVSIEHEQVSNRLEEGGKAFCKQLRDELKPVKSAVYGLMSGNHFMEFNENISGKTVTTHSDKWLADLMGVPYLGAMCFITITLRDKDNYRNQCDVRVIAHHGAGGATTIGGSLNRVQRMATGWECDIAIMGDDHKRGCVPIGDKLAVHNHQGVPLVTSKTQWVGRTGSFMRGFEPGKRSYVVDAAYNPLNLGTIEFELKLKKHSKTGKPYVSIGGYQPA